MKAPGTPNATIVLPFHESVVIYSWVVVSEEGACGRRGSRPWRGDRTDVVLYQPTCPSRDGRTYVGRVCELRGVRNVSKLSCGGALAESLNGEWDEGLAGRNDLADSEGRHWRRAGGKWCLQSECC